MKRFTLSVLTLATVASSFVFTSCKKDKDDPKPKSKTELITAKNWRVTGDIETEVIGGQTVTVDNYATYQPCDKDDYTKFDANKVFKDNEGTLRCNPAAPQETTGTWDFNSDQTKLLVNIPGLPIVVQSDILELTATTLKIKTSSGSGATLETQTLTFTAF
jgi:hypothetical protein